MDKFVTSDTSINLGLNCSLFLFMEPLKLSYYILVIVVMLLSLVFLCLPVRNDDRFAAYNYSRKMFALGYLVFGLYNIFEMYTSPEVLSCQFLFVANLLTHLFGLAHVNLVNQDKINSHYVWKIMAPMGVCALLFGVSTLFPPPPLPITA